MAWHRWPRRSEGAARPARAAAPALLLAALVLGGCALSMSPAAPTPTIVRIPPQTRAAVATMQAATLWAAATAPEAAAATAAPTLVVTPTSATATEAAATEPAMTTVPPAASVTPAAMANTPAPAATAIVHVVAVGENLTTIAVRYGVTVADIVAANAITNPSVIVIGQQLAIPAASGTPTAATAAPPAASATAAPPVPAPTAAAASAGAISAGTIAFQVASGAGIYVVSADGTGLHQLTSGIDPEWSPDGTMLAFARWTVPWGLYVISADGSGERMVLQTNLLRGPTWSPDGRRLAFTRQEGGSPATRLCLPGHGCFNLPAEVNSPLGLVDLDGGRREDPLADSRSLTPDWSVDGALLYAGELGLRRTDLAGEPAFLLADVSAFYPRASPDGTRVALMYEQHDHWEIYTLAADGSDLRRLTSSPPFSDHPANNVAPEWSPDGSQILYLSDRDGGWRPYIMAADGSSQQPFLPEVFDGIAIQYQYAAEHVFSWR